MSVIQINKTPEELAKDRIVAIGNISDESLINLINSFEQAYCKFWGDENPQELLDILGNNAYKIFQSSADTIAYIMKFRPSYTPPDVIKPYVINPDGTVTLTEEWQS